MRPDSGRIRVFRSDCATIVPPQNDQPLRFSDKRPSDTSIEQRQVELCRTSGGAQQVCWIGEPAVTEPRKVIERCVVQNLSGNLRYAMRQFRLSPIFAAAAVLTLALGIGGTTAIFTLIHAVMLRSLPVS